MQLNLPDDTIPIKEMFERFFETESTSARIRAAEPIGFDADLWRSLLELEAPFLRVPEAQGGGGMNLLDACLMLEQAGRHLASVPLAESIVALRILAQAGGNVAREWIEKVRSGEAILTLALHPAVDGTPQLVPGGAVAKGILTFDGKKLAIAIPGEALQAPFTLGGNALGLFTPGTAFQVIVSTAAEAADIWAAGIEEWKLLTSAALIGLSHEALAMASAYACERIAFGVPIGVNQGLSHPLANDVIDADAGAMMLWWTLTAIADGREDAGGAISALFWWANRTASNSVAHALHTFGGYGLTNEYDIQLYHRRAKSWGLALGDPEEELIRAGRRLYRGEAVSLPDTGQIALSFEAPGKGSELAAETRALFQSILDPVKHRLGESNFEAHDWDVHRTMGEAGLLFPDWPTEWGGRGASADEARASLGVWHEVGYIGHARSVTGMVGSIVRHFGQQDLKEEVLLRFARGEITACLGYTEPSGGSDVFAAKTRAVRDGDDWVVNGQKMFTSGAELADFVLMIARTDPDVPKHKGLTLFLVPLKGAGVEIQPVHTFMDERTNATFYADVRIPDRYRLGDVNAGVRVMAAALSMEQGGAGFYSEISKMLNPVVEWARGQTRDDRPMLEHPSTLARLAHSYLKGRLAFTISARALWTGISGAPDQAHGPASKVFATEAFISTSADLIDLAAPFSLIRGKEGLGIVEMGYRHSTATSIYGGTSEVLRSLVAERRLGLPRSRA